MFDSVGRCSYTGQGTCIRVPIDLQNGKKLLLVVSADGALLYRRAKIKVAMSQTEVVATVLNEGVQSAHAQIPYFLWAQGDDLESHLKNAGYELLQRYTTNEFVVQFPSEYPGEHERMAKVNTHQVHTYTRNAHTNSNSYMCICARLSLLWVTANGCGLYLDLL